MLKNSLLLIVCLLAIAGLLALGVKLEWESVSWKQLGELFLEGFQQESQTALIFWQLRLPRLVLALVVGACLGFSGYLIQVLVNNPLADPYILGASTGASFGINLALCGIIPVFVGQMYLPPLLAFGGAMIVMFLVLLIAWGRDGFGAFKMLLAGIALSSTFNAMTSLLIYTSDSADKFKNILFWTMGSFDRATWVGIRNTGVVLLINVILMLFMWKQINMLYLGQQRARSLGLPVNAVVALILISTSLVTGLAIAEAGPIGFVGLIIPHFVRAVFGAGAKLNLVFAVLFGAIFMLACEVISKPLMPPSGLPVGVISSFIGIPIFIYLIYKSSYKFN